MIGIGISNIPLIKFLAKNGAHVTAYDRRGKEQLGEVYFELRELGVEIFTGENYLDNLSGELIFKTPGLRFDNPALIRAEKNGAEITSEMELFAEFCPAKIIAVTGSDGKTTTTTLIYKMLEHEGYKAWLGGNIGKPLFCSLEEISDTDVVVLELSSFQLHTMKTSPQVAVITNISPNHLDMHKDYAEYIDAKKNIMRYQGENDALAVNHENAVCDKIGKEARGALRTFGYSASCAVHEADGVIYCEGQEILKTADIKIPGRHNVENYMAAIAAVGDMVSRETIEFVAKSFGGVEHRIEHVRTLGNVSFYNSSIDSSPNRSINTLSVFPERVVMIAGGKDKGIAYDELGPALVKHVKTLILIGATAGKIREALEKSEGREAVEVIECEEYAEAVNIAYERAKPKGVVLLSPASTSFDRFRNFEERGNLFKALVCGLTE